MRKINLATDRVRVDKKALLDAVNSGEKFGITVEGEVCRAPFDPKKLWIFQGEKPAASPISGGGADLWSGLFPAGYRVEEDETKLTIDASGAWNDIVALNRAGALYDDTTNEGIMDFADEELEEINWHSIEFGITARNIAEIIESNCEGTLFCLHREEPFVFSALVYVDDIEAVRETVRNTVKTRIERLIQTDPDYHPSLFDEEQEEAAEYLGLSL